MNDEVNSMTPFCLGCGQWVVETDELSASPFTFCSYCDPTKKKTRKKGSKKGRL